ncbi:hypothetical protein AWC18_02740 [Mycolicibacter nonchromogenicus]|uniref:Uncharacterized protein n=1 Tax=Mycolicibacter nonchromogenicus TaxID=1782 RepID=A0A1X1ZMV8_MYCNO|nr:hypothetical protein [Mycolicibacter nonchromogenicus]ORW24687.1 hypothetical protein AWC18_02740 [Mycolicibacter nonchromogenicus]
MGDSAHQCFLVEWYQPDLADATVDTVMDRLASAVAEVHAKLVLALTSPSDETLFAVVSADSSEAVVTACRQAEWRVDRITAGVRARIGADEGWV